MSVDKSLPEKMRAYADRYSFVDDHEMRRAADMFEAAVKGYFAEPQTCAVKAFFTRWAVARRIWCKYSGEELI